MSSVVVDFRVGGIADVQKALSGIEASLAKVARASGASQKSSTREFEQGEREKSRIAEREAKQKIRYYQNADRVVARAQAQSIREFERGEREKERISSQWVRRREQEEIESARRVLAERRRFASALAGAAGHGVRAGMGAVGGIATRLAGTALSLGGGFGVADSLERATRIGGMASDISNSGFLPNGDIAANRTKRSSGDISSAARATSVKYGMSTESTLSGLQKFVGKSGDLDTGLKTMDELAQLSRATGASFEDVSDAAGDLMSQLGHMPNKGEAVMTVMRGIAAQGKLGAVEMRDLASQMAKLAASAGQFGGNAVDNILKMGMLAQEARGGGGAASAAIAGTSVAGFVSTLKTPARIAQFRAHGINVFDKNKMLRDPQEIILESLKATGGDPEQMKKMFANVMGERAVTGYANIYRRAGGGGAGETAVRGEFDKMLKNATMSKADVAQAASSRMRENDVKIQQAREEFDRAVANDLLPEFMKMIPAIKDMTPTFIALAREGLPAFLELIRTASNLAKALGESGIGKQLAQHPIGAIISAYLVRDLASAGIGAAVQRAIVALIGGGGGAGGAASALKGGGKSLRTAAAGAVAAAGLAAGLDTYGSNADTYGATAQGAVGELGAMIRAVNAGTATPEQLAEYKKRAGQISSSLGAAKGTMAHTRGIDEFSAGLNSAGETALGYVGLNYSGSKYRDEATEQTKARSLADNAGAIETSLLQFSKALDRVTQQANATADSAPARSRPMVSFERGGTQS